MVHRRISSDVKEIALDLWNRGWELVDICDALSVSERSVYRWRAIFEEFGSVTRPPSPLCGRPRILTRALMSVIHLIYKEHPSTYLDELVWYLAIYHDIDVSLSTLQRNLDEVGLTWKAIQRLAAERDEQLRGAWRDEVQENFVGNGCEFVFVDETSKNDRSYARRHGRSLANERAQLIDCFQRGQRYSVAAALSRDGYVAVRAVPGSFDAEEFYDFIAEEVIPQMKPFPDERSTLVLDNCRIHHNDALVQLVAAAGCLLLYLPPYSPDLNPIEESFSALKQYIRHHGDELRQWDDPIAAILEASGCVTADMARGWFSHAGYITDDVY